MSSHQKKIVFYCLFMSCLFSTCGSQDDNATPDDWLIPANQVFDGGPGKDGIPSIDQPQFSTIEQIDFLEPDDLVVGIKVGNEIRAYPHPILDWHEIVNDNFINHSLTITYCPLTGTGIAWDREIEGQITSFGVSGLLYNTNLIPYDRASDSNWSQMLNQSVEGERSGTSINTFPTIETSWETWQSLFPDSKILNTNTGFNRSYGDYPYGDYRINNSLLIFPVSPTDNRLPAKQRGLGLILGENAKFYALDKFNAPIVIIEDQFQNIDLVILGSKERNFIAAYESRLADGIRLEFTGIQNSDDEGLMQDQEGNVWNLFGEAIDGPRKGTILKPTNSFMGYWFAWGAFYPGVEIF